MTRWKMVAARLRRVVRAIGNWRARAHGAAPRRRFSDAEALIPEEQREVLILAAVEGLDNAEIARRLGLTTEAVERLLADGLCRLARAEMRGDCLRRERE